MGSNFFAVAGLLLTQVRPADHRASMPTRRRDRSANHRPGARKPQLPSQPPPADHSLAPAARRRDRRARAAL